MILAALACPVFTSCYDDSALNDRIDGIEEELGSLEERVAALEKRLNDDLAALQTLLESKIAALQGEVDALVTVSKCEKQNDGSYQITLSDGTSFTVYPEYIPEAPDQTGLVTTTEMGGVLYWAIFEDGKPVVVTDAEGNPVPVVDVVPQVRVDAETGLVEISFDGGNEWIAVGYNTPCVFSNSEIIYTDNYTDEEEAQGWGVETPMYVVLTLPDGSTISVTIDGAASFVFGGHMGGLVTSQYIACGTTTEVGFMTTNISDWVKEVPAGWKVEEVAVENAQYGGASFRITAPTAEAIASGAAVADGKLKVLAVAEGGKTISASIDLTTVAFKKFYAGKGTFTVEMNQGLGGYVVGVSTVETFDPEAIVAELTPLIEEVEESPWGSYPNWPNNNTSYDYFEYSVTDYAVTDLMSVPELTLGEQYVVWALSVNTWTDANWNFGYTAGTMYSTLYNNVSVEVETTALSFNDIQIKATFEGVSMFYGAFSQKYSDISAEEQAAALLSEFNAYIEYETPKMVNDEYVEGWDNGVFTGDPNTMMSGWQSYNPGTTYYFYIIPYVEGKTNYSLADMYYYEWTTDSLMPGGAIAVTAAEPVLDFKKVAVDLAAENATYIYYSFVEPSMISTIADKQAYLLEKGYRVEGAAASVTKAGLTPGATTTLIAMAIDEYGCYGDVFQQDYTTKTMEYATAVVTAELQGTPSQTGLVKLACDGEVDAYYYWYGDMSAWQWTNASYFGGSAETASAFIALTPDSYLLTKVAAAELPAEGVMMEGLVVGTPNVFVVSAKLTDGTFTKATIVEFTPQMNLGNFVYATDDNGAENPVWAAAKPTVTSSLESVGDFTHISWSVSVPAGFTAKTVCVHEDYLTDYPSPKQKVQFFLTYEYIDLYDVVEGETYSYAYGSKGCNIYVVLCDYEGNYYEAYETKLDISGGFGV